MVIVEIERNVTMEEIWCPIKGYEGQYEVSDQGRVKSLKYDKERILKPGRDSGGYLFVSLCKNGDIKNWLVHRLVAKTFIPNPNNLPEVNHKDEDKANNFVQNLEWCDEKYNNNYGTRIQRVSDKISKPVLQYTESGVFVREWKSIQDAQRNLNYGHGNISHCCNGKRKYAYGYIWKFKD